MTKTIIFDNNSVEKYFMDLLFHFDWSERNFEDKDLMPNRNGGSSTSDTGAAVIMRDGWSAAETRAKDTESMFCEAETKYLRLILSYIKEFKPDFDLPLVALRINFTRRNYENIATKSQVLINLLSCDKVHPLYAYISCGMFPDPEEAYNKGMEYYEQNSK